MKLNLSSSHITFYSPLDCVNHCWFVIAWLSDLLWAGSLHSCVDVWESLSHREKVGYIFLCHTVLSHVFISSVQLHWSSVDISGQPLTLGELQISSLSLEVISQVNLLPWSGGVTHTTLLLTLFLLPSSPIVLLLLLIIMVAFAGSQVIASLLKFLLIPKSCCDNSLNSFATIFGDCSKDSSNFYCLCKLCLVVYCQVTVNTILLSTINIIII